ncbi:MAG: hypothetical protein AAGB29_06915 [Planctomycetota bacterium]
MRAAALWISTCLAMTLATAASGRVTGEVDALTEVIEGFEQNQQALRTWQGSATIKRWKHSDDKLVGESEVDFISDRSNDAIAWKRTVLAVPSEDPEDFEPYETSGMLSDGRIVWVAPRTREDRHDRDGQPHGVNVHVREPEAGPRPLIATDDAFNPGLYFNPVVNNTPQTLRFYLQNRHNPDMYPATVTRQGSRVVLEITNPTEPHNKIINRYTFDLSSGFNLVESYFESEGNRTATTTKYQLVNKVYVPAVSTTVSQRGSQTIRKVETLFTSNRVNEPIPADAFTLEGIGVRDGDYILDTITNKSSWYQPD